MGGLDISALGGGFGQSEDSGAHWSTSSSLKSSAMKLLVSVLALAAVASAARVPTSDARCPPRDAAFPVYFRDEANCAVFYQCSNGVAYKFDCPAGTLFDTTLNVCNWPDAVICDEGSGSSEESSEEGSGSSSEESSEEGSGSSEESGEGSGDEPVDPVDPDDTNKCKNVPSDVYKQFPHPTDCTKYITCSHQREVEQVCPPNLYYNPTLKVCDVPERAGCVAEELLEFSKA
ncbi:Peritrophin-1 [Amphibalanus amphitrite]|uniref:Peritrophin-1 n=1 Tax=Amphibalanus amphitrite TaxID=1232801 RepID=A0A6A4W5W6_AMPAM|nr:Peritrophin-1 [Amphibalanus amphitrite]